MDVSGEHQLDVLHSVFKVRLTEDGHPIQEEAQQYELGKTEEETEKGGVGGVGDNKAEAGKVVKQEDQCGRYSQGFLGEMITFIPTQHHYLSGFGEPPSQTLRQLYVYQLLWC